MNKNLLSFLTLILFGSALLAQDKAEINVKITKDGALVKDTTYIYNDLKQAKHAIQMMEMMSSDELYFASANDAHMEMMTNGHQATKKMMFVSEDGEITELNDDEVKWVSENGEKIWVSEEDGKTEVIVRQIKEGNSDNDGMMKKKMIIISDTEGGENATWTVNEGDDGELMMINEDGESIKMIRKIREEGDEDGKTVEWVSDGDDDNMKVIVIKEGGDKDEEIEVEIIFKEEKDSKKKENKKKK